MFVGLLCALRLHAGLVCSVLRMQTMLMACKPEKKLTLIHKSIPIDELIAYLKPKLKYFVHHNFVANW